MEGDGYQTSETLPWFNPEGGRGDVIPVYNYTAEVDVTADKALTLGQAGSAPSVVTIYSAEANTSDLPPRRRWPRWDPNS